jgi:hypothetical protein
VREFSSPGPCSSGETEAVHGRLPRGRRRRLNLTFGAHLELSHADRILGASLNTMVLATGPSPASAHAPRGWRRAAAAGRPANHLD